MKDIYIYPGEAEGEGQEKEFYLKHSFILYSVSVTGWMAGWLVAGHGNAESPRDSQLWCSFCQRCGRTELEMKILTHRTQNSDVSSRCRSANMRTTDHPPPVTTIFWVELKQ